MTLKFPRTYTMACIEFTHGQFMAYLQELPIVVTLCNKEKNIAPYICDAMACHQGAHSQYHDRWGNGDSLHQAIIKKQDIHEELPSYYVEHICDLLKIPIPKSYADTPPSKIKRRFQKEIVIDRIGMN